MVAPQGRRGSLLHFAEVARSLARRRWVAASAAALAIGGFAAGWLPLLDAPGYELGMAGAWIAAVLAAPLGIAAWRLERERPEPSAAAAAGGTFLVLGALLAIFLAANAARAWAGPCRVLASWELFPLLALPSAALGAALAVTAATLARGRAAPAALYAATALVSLAVALGELYLGPQAFALDPLLGWWPGPLYDEALRPDARLVLFRLETLAAAFALGAAVEARARRARRAPAAAAMLLFFASASGAVAARAAISWSGLAGDRATLARVLGGEREGAACRIVYPAEKPEIWASAFLSDCEFHAHDLSRELGLPAPPRVTVYVHRSAAEKRRLVGAAATDYTKPWLREIQIADAPLPHPTLRHELVHAVSGAVAGRPLRVPARAGVLVSMGLVEGLAVALELPRGEWTAHQWSRAMRDLGLLPEMARIVEPAGFFAAAPARAYTATGSFLRFLLERRGAAAVAALYRTSDFEASMGAPLAALVGEWQRFLDGVDVPPPLASAARQRFGRGSIFARRCAREAAALEQDAARTAGGRRAVEACALLRREAELTGSPAPLVAAADVLSRAGDLDGAGRALQDAGSWIREDDAVQRRALFAAEGDLAWRRGELGAAAARWLEALVTRPERADARLLRAKIAAVEDSDLSRTARPWLLGEGDPAQALAGLAASRHPLAAYLVGRAALARGDAALALPGLARAVEARLPEPIALEARFLLADAECAAGNVSAGESALATLLREAPGAADRERAAAGLTRCAFERERRSQ